MNLATPESVQKLQTALHAKAKKSPDLRFYALYDKMYRKDVLTFAYNCCKANGGAAGVDNQTFEDIEAYGAERWLDELTQELKGRTYQPLPVRRVPYALEPHHRILSQAIEVSDLAEPPVAASSIPASTRSKLSQHHSCP